MQALEGPTLSELAFRISGNSFFYNGKTSEMICQKKQDDELEFFLYQVNELESQVKTKTMASDDRRQKREQSKRESDRGGATVLSRYIKKLVAAFR